MTTTLTSLPCPPRYGTPRDPSRPTLGPAVAQVMEWLGQPPTPWQQHVLDVALEVDPDTGRLYYREVRLWVPRQSGKTTLLLGLMLHRCLSWQDQRVSYTAQTRNHARKKFEDEHIPILKRCRRLRGKFRTRMTNGNEALLWPSTGSRWGIESTTKKAGHGDSLDLVVADEFFAQEDDRIEAGSRPTMITRPQPMIVFVSTFGDDDEGESSIGEPMWRKVADSRERCTSGQHGRVASFEWSAADEDHDGIDYGDRGLWRRTMPALQCNGGIIPEEAVAADYESMSLAAFKRAYLNLKPRRTAKPKAVPADQWADALDEGYEMGSARVAFGVDVAPDASWASIVAVQRRPDGAMHLEVIDHEQGADWLEERLSQRIKSNRPLALGWDAGGPTAAYTPEIERALGPRCKPVKLRGGEWQAACASFLADLKDRKIRHGGDALLDAAVSGAVRKTVGQSWIWDRAGVDITPLAATTAALRAYDLHAPRRSIYEDDE